MKYYTLFNKSNGKKLIHPKIGVWFTLDLKEAESMLAACHEYLDSQRLQALKSQFIIIDAETGEEVSVANSFNA